MKSFETVIGLNFGDEGKGLFTEYLSRRVRNEKSLVVSFNGGSQKGHNVKLPNGVSHVFHHFGCGTFSGLPTYLNEDYIINPITFRKEYDTLVRSGYIPKTYIDFNAKITNPIDMIINQGLEKLRNKSNHGSCGLGIFETIKRYELGIHKIEDMRTYACDRIRSQGFKVPDYLRDLIYNDGIQEQFQKDVAFMLDVDYPVIVTDSILNSYDHIIFEGAQGLLLDQDNLDYFPHLTPSTTGIKNIMRTTNSFGVKGELNYITRCYMTRHGAGTFETETNTKPYAGIYDNTNYPNEFQGTLRFGILDLDLMKKSLEKDLKYNTAKHPVNIVITCLDQLKGEQIRYKLNNKEESTKYYPIREIIDIILTNVYNFDKIFLSYGETRETILNPK